MELTCELLYICSVGFMKLALGFLFLRFLLVPWQRRVVYVVMSLSTVYTLCIFFIILFQCGNPNLIIVEGWCLNSRGLNIVTYLHAALNAFTDWIFAILPIFFLRKLDANIQTKISVWSILALGSL